MGTSRSYVSPGQNARGSRRVSAKFGTMCEAIHGSSAAFTPPTANSDAAAGRARRPAGGARPRAAGSPSRGPPPRGTRRRRSRDGEERIALAVDLDAVVLVEGAAEEHVVLGEDVGVAVAAQGAQPGRALDIAETNVTVPLGSGRVTVIASVTAPSSLGAAVYGGAVNRRRAGTTPCTRAGPPPGARRPVGSCGARRTRCACDRARAWDGR